MKKFANTRWFTNLAAPRKEKLELLESYSPEKYRNMENYPAINVNRTADIPNDYFDLMGVPITYIDRHDPIRFRILDEVTPIIDGRRKYKRLVIKRK